MVGVCLPANERIGPGDGYLVGEIAALPRRPQLVAIATKSDLATPTRMAEHLTAIAALEEQHGIRWAHIVPVSATHNDQTDLLADSWSACCRTVRRSTRTARSPTNRPRRWSPS